MLKEKVKQLFLQRLYRKYINIMVGALVLALIPISPSHISSAPFIKKSKMFDLSDSATELIRKKALHNGTVLQSFAFDNVNHHIYIVQLMAGGQQLPGEDKPISGSKRALNGDIALTKLDLLGKKLGYMILKGFGHGVQIGVQMEGNTAYLWTETDSVPKGRNGWGTQLARFPFKNEMILTQNSPELEKYRLIEGADRSTVNIDSTHGLLTMRYRKDGAFRFGVYNLEEVKQHKYTALADVPQPAMGTFQGFASFGNYLYLLEGNEYGANGSVAPYGNTYITSVDLNTGKVMDKQLMSTGNTLSYREPEGMAIRIPDTKHPHKAQLCFGFASNFMNSRRANIYCLDRLLPVENKITQVN